MTPIDRCAKGGDDGKAARYLNDWVKISSCINGKGLVGFWAYKRFVRYTGIKIDADQCKQIEVREVKEK